MLGKSSTAALQRNGGSMVRMISGEVDLDREWLRVFKELRVILPFSFILGPVAAFTEMQHRQT